MSCNALLAVSGNAGFLSRDSVLLSVIELFKFDDFYEISLGTTVIFLFVAIGWSVLLRRKIREQAAQIRQQFERESRLQAQYRDLFENANDIIFTLDPAGFIQVLNHTGETLFGCPRERARTMRFDAFLPPAQTASFNQWLKSCTAGELHPCEATILGSQGKRSILELVARPVLTNGKCEALEIIARDITERKSAEIALRQSEERFSSAFRASPVAIAITSFPEGRITDVNGSFIKLFGYERDEVLGRTALDLGLWEQVEARNKIEQALRENSSLGGVECRFRVKTGGQRTALVFMEKITTGETSSVLWLSHDMTDRLSLEAQIRHLTKMEAVGRLAAGVAHDFNNLLTVIQGNTVMAVQRAARQPELTHSLNNIQEAAQRAAHLTRQLLTFSRKNNIALGPIDLNLAVTHATRMFKHMLRADIGLRINFASRLPVVMGDATMIEQVLMNLVVNARDAMPHGGELNISTSLVHVDPAYKLRHAEACLGDYACVQVSDSGSGMDTAIMTRIFEPFFTTKKPGEGTGLGLATVYGIVKQHNGWVEVSSQLGTGSTFRVLLPVDRTATLPPASGALPPRDSILLLEDEPAILDLVARLLADQGHHVHRASSGIEAMQIWTEHTRDIKVLLTDIRMPHGMSGYDVAENLLALNPALKVIFMSGYPSESPQLGQMLRQGAQFLAKPCPPPTLNETVNKMLASARDRSLN